MRESPVTIFSSRSLIRACGCAGWDEESWGTGDSGPLQRAWESLSQEQQAAAQLLGYLQSDFGWVPDADDVPRWPTTMGGHSVMRQPAVAPPNPSGWRLCC